MKITKTRNGHGDVMYYNIEDIDAHKISERKLRFIINFLDEILEME